MAEHEPSIGATSDWYTPPEIFAALDLTFDLDPCSPGRGLGFVPAQRIYTKADDGLHQPWHGLVFMNPPFGERRGQVPWLQKFFAHGNGIALVAARTSADWFHEVLVPRAELLCFPNCKTKFIRPSVPWFELPLYVRSMWWRETDYNWLPPSPDLLASIAVILDRGK